MIADRSNASLTVLRTKCATCPCGTKSSTEGGNIISCSISQSRKVFPMPYKRQNFFTTSTKNCDYSDKLLVQKAKGSLISTERWRAFCGLQESAVKFRLIRRLVQPSLDISPSENRVQARSRQWSRHSASRARDKSRSFRRVLLLLKGRRGGRKYH